MSKLEEMLNNFTAITRKFIISLEQDNFDNAELYMKKREEIIKQLRSLEYTKDEFKSIVDKTELVQLDIQLETLLKENIASVKEKIRDFNISKEAYINYNKFAGRTPTFINQKI